jgi:C_GCAxxG_C_C family probable redox protein
LLAAFGTGPVGDREALLWVSSSFGCGIAGMGLTCGAVTGALMAVGMKYGPQEKSKTDGQTRLEKAENEFLERFRALHGTLCCNELRGVDAAAGRYRKGRNELCAKFVRDAGEILEEML